MCGNVVEKNRTGGDVMLLNNLKSIVILVTMDCNCSCDHCFYFPRNDNHAHIDPDLIDDALESISDQHNIKTVHFAGGEPFFYYDVMVECIKRCKNHGIDYFSVSTNGAWANEPEVVREKVDHLHELGVNSIGVSADSFHQRTIPLENVFNILKTETPTIEGSIGGLSFSTYAIASYIGYQSHDCSFNRQTDAIVQRIYNAGYYVFPTVAGAHGRANFIIPDKLHVNEKSNRKCWVFNIGVLHPEGPAAVLIDPSGFVDGCFGVPLGNLYKASMIDIFKSYFDDPNPIIRRLHENGARGLKQLAVERGFRPKNAYYDECHLCHMARNYLKKHCTEEFGDYLAPDTCYPTITDPKVQQLEQGYGKGK